MPKRDYNQYRKRRAARDPAYKALEAARNKERYERKREQYRKRMAEHYEANRNAILARRREHRKANPDLVAERSRRYRRTGFDGALYAFRHGAIGLDEFNRRVSESFTRLDEKHQAELSGRDKLDLQLCEADSKSDETET